MTIHEITIEACRRLGMTEEAIQRKVALADALSSQGSIDESNQEVTIPPGVDNEKAIRVMMSAIKAVSELDPMDRLKLQMELFGHIQSTTHRN